ncbi:YkgJ family cysteine cluster protein [Haloferula sp. A504]|uniref:YkgJ family cysteine cluster protein n=1 Tax=Haloferula sp. A504 TaxID=3373601 RepID=UPI0031C8754D|nr:YkgJ family cysteine cluster protein [Verrucomicrobiaceae bacterium E54]
MTLPGPGVLAVHPSALAANPCLACGACCAFFRVSFHWMETDAGGGTVPTGLAEPVDLHRVAMRGTTCSPVRCNALEGEVGTSVRCTIHPLRPSVCRAFQPAWENGEPNPDCDRARAQFGLPPLAPGWHQPDDDSPPEAPAPDRRAA